MTNNKRGIKKDTIIIDDPIMNDETISIMPDLKKVMDRETKEVVIIDANKEPDRKKKFLHCS